MKQLLFKVLHYYRAHAPARLKNGCRYSPTCSWYMEQAIQKKGVVKGTLMGLQRIARCRPPYGGLDEP